MVRSWKVRLPLIVLVQVHQFKFIWVDSLPDAIQSECSKCSEKQKAGSEKVTHFLIDNKPDEWQKLADKYDKDDEYKKKYLLEKEEQKSKSANESKDSEEEDWRIAMNN